MDPRSELQQNKGGVFLVVLAFFFFVLGLIPLLGWLQWVALTAIVVSLVIGGNFVRLLALLLSIGVILRLLCGGGII